MNKVVISLQGWFVVEKKLSHIVYENQVEMSNKREDKGWRRPSHFKQCSLCFCVCVYACAISSLVLLTLNRNLIHCVMHTTNIAVLDAIKLYTTKSY